MFSDFGDDSEDNSDMEAETVNSRRTSQFNTKASASRLVTTMLEQTSSCHYEMNIYSLLIEYLVVCSLSYIVPSAMRLSSD